MASPFVAVIAPDENGVRCGLSTRTKPVYNESSKGWCAWNVQHAHESESEGDAKQKRHRRGDGGRRNGAHDVELEDGEVGEDGEIQ